ncbi:MAG: type II toxin-antitoxin system PemK/MazF family toxin [Bryobacteraceae bacterium]
MAPTRLARKHPGKTSDPKRGEIYLTALDPALGSEIRKTRPGVVIQNNTSNRLTQTTIVAPITSTVRFPLNPVHVLLSADKDTGLTVPSVALLSQIRVVDRQRLIHRIGTVDEATLRRIDTAIKISLDVS